MFETALIRSGKVFQLLLIFILSFGTKLALADVSGSWQFNVSLGQLGSGTAAITLTQEADGKLSGTYSGQLAQSAVTGTYEGNDFEFSFNSAAVGTNITYDGTLNDDGTVSGTVSFKKKKCHLENCL